MRRLQNPSARVAPRPPCIVTLGFGRAGCHPGRLHMGFCKRLTMNKQRALMLTCALAALTAGAQELERLRVQRKEVFEFARKPEVTVDGDRVTVTFAVKDYCDVTVAIENPSTGSTGSPQASSGQAPRIVRHLAAGVLGKNAPAPFEKGLLKQTLVWDGKDDLERYVDDKDRLTVRVSLGLKPRFERTLFWSPRSRVPAPRYLSHNLVFAAGAEGIYVYDGHNCDHIRLFDGKGDYSRTVYPPPPSQIEQYKGLEWMTAPQDGRKIPVKGGSNRETFLNTGSALRAMAAHGGRLAVAGERLNFIEADGGSFEGPNVFVPVYVSGVHEWRGGVVNVSPTDMAFSLDGKWIYLAGYMCTRSWNFAMVNGVGRIAADGTGTLENFVGSLGALSGSKSRVHKPFADALKGNPLDPAAFKGAASVAVDAQGRVYVADTGNNRIRVFLPDGKHLKDVPSPEPALVRVHPENGEIYVFNYRTPITPLTMHDRTVPPTVTRLKSLDNPEVLFAAHLPHDSQGRDAPACSITVDFRTDPPTIWMGDRAHRGYSVGTPSATAAMLMVEKDRKLAVTRNFGADAQREIAYIRGARHMKRRLYFDHKNRKLYVGDLGLDPHPEHVTTMSDGAVIDPDTGKVLPFSFPMGAEDMAFDMEGHAYLRGFDHVVRYDSTTWREVPFDYGEERASGGQWGKNARIFSALTFFSTSGIASGQLGGMGVSPKGRVIVSACNPGDTKTEGRYMPPIFPGRSRVWEIHVFDRHGKPLYVDALPGVGRMVGVQMDKEDNLYVMAAGAGRVAGKPYYHPFSTSLIKARPGTKLLSTSGAPIPLTDALRPERAPDLTRVDGGGSTWALDGARWIRGGAGFDGKRVHCHCGSQSRFALDYFARSFLPEVDRCSVLAIDANNNEIVRIGRYGNIDDGVPLIREGGPPNPRSLGGDEVGIMHAQMLTVESDRRLFIGDLGNACIRSVKLDYHVEERIPLGGIPETSMDRP